TPARGAIPARGLVLRDVAVQRLYWLVSGQGYGDSGRGAKVFVFDSILARGFNPKGQQSITPDKIFREQALFINKFTRVMGFLITWGFQPLVMMKEAPVLNVVS
ncbi:MAG: hypothetical protein GY754_12890, partial [bacterium]|nr:hypothetical protein [bacterium]